MTVVRGLAHSGAGARGPRRRGARVVAALALVIAMVAGCAGSELEGPATRSTTAAVATAAGGPAAMRAEAGIPECPAASPAPAVPAGLPDLELACLGGDGAVRLGALRGPAVVNLWAVWCTPCRLEAPHLAELGRLAGDRVAVVGIDTADPDPQAAADFCKAAGWRHVQLADPQHRVADALGLKGLPVTLFIAADGRVVHRQVGAVGSTEQLRTLIAQHLEVTV